MIGLAVWLTALAVGTAVLTIAMRREHRRLDREAAMRRILAPVAKNFVQLQIVLVDRLTPRAAADGRRAERSRPRHEAALRGPGQGGPLVTSSQTPLPGREPAAGDHTEAAEHGSVGAAGPTTPAGQGTHQVRGAANTTEKARIAHHPYWHGMLCRDTLDEIAERMREVLTGRYFTLVTCNSYDEASDRFASVDVYPSQFLTGPIDSSQTGWAYVGWATPRLSMGLHTKAKTLQEARDGRPHKYVHMTFEPREIKIDHYAPAGYRLLWVLAVEDHDSEDLIFSPGSPEAGHV